MFHFHKKSLRFSENFRFCSTASARFLEMKRLFVLREEKCIEQPGKVNSLEQVEAWRLWAPPVGKAAWLGLALGFQELLRKQKPSGIGESLDC